MKANEESEGKASSKHLRSQIQSVFLYVVRQCALADLCLPLLEYMKDVFGCALPCACRRLSVRHRREWQEAALACTVTQWANTGQKAALCGLMETQTMRAAAGISSAHYTLQASFFVSHAQTFPRCMKTMDLESRLVTEDKLVLDVPAARASSRAVPAGGPMVAAWPPLWRVAGRSSGQRCPRFCHPRALGRWEVAPTPPEGNAPLLPDASCPSLQLLPPHALFKAEFKNLICMRIVSGIWINIFGKKG